MKYPRPFDNACITMSGYSADQDIRIPYLGFKKMDKRVTVHIEAQFNNDKEIEDVKVLWGKEIDLGQGYFIVHTRIFGEMSDYILRAIGPLSHSLSNEINMLNVDCEVMYDDINFINNLPTVSDITENITKNTHNNIIMLQGVDKDGDALTYTIHIGTGIGTLTTHGDDKVYYTPDPDVIGTDCFTYIASDKYGNSNTGLVKLVIADAVMPDTEIQYDVSGPIEVSGTYYVDKGDGRWTKGYGGIITAIAGTLKLRSYDSIVEENYMPNVTSIKVLKYGARTNWDRLCANSATPFSASSTAGSCVGTTFDEFYYKNTSGVFPYINFSRAKSAVRLFAGCSLTTLRSMNLPTVDDIRGFASGCKLLEKVGNIQTPKCRYFQDAFSDTPEFTCLGGIDTTNKIATSNMFFGAAKLTNPDLATQGTILTGMKFVSATKCVPNVATIARTSNAPTCHITQAPAKCKSEATYKVTFTADPASTIVWSTGGTIKSGQGTDTVVIESIESSASADVWVRCVVTDPGSGTIDTGKQLFNYEVTSDILKLELPKSYTQINLRAFIDANNPTHQKNVLVTNKVENCSITTGDLTGLTVELHNSSKLSGFRFTNKHGVFSTERKESALILTSTLKLTNIGTLRGSGGVGGRGNKGYSGSLSRPTYYAGGYGAIGIGYDGPPIAPVPPQRTKSNGYKGADSGAAGGWGESGKVGRDNGYRPVPHGRYTPGPGHKGGYAIEGVSHLTADSVKGTLLGGEK